MPKTTRSGKPKQSELPSTLQNSGGKAQRTFTKAYDAAIDRYGDEQRAHQVAFAALKYTHEKVGDRWRKKEKGRKGPSDAQAEGGRETNRPTAGGVDTRASQAAPLRPGQAAADPRSVVDVEGGAGRRPAEGERPAVRDVTREEGEREGVEGRQGLEEVEEVEEVIGR